MLEELRMPLAATAGAVVGLGCTLLLLARSHEALSSLDVPGRRRKPIGKQSRAVSGRMALIGVLAGLATLAITRWVVLAVVVAGVIAFWNRLFGGARQERVAINRVEGLATWIEALRDTIAGAVGLEQAIPATAANAAPTIRPSLNLLVDRLRVREPLPNALAKFGDDLDDPSADLAIAALILNARLRGPGLRDVLSALATSARDELDVRRRVEASRRSTRRSVQVVVGVIVVVAGLLVLFNRQYVEPYGTVEGQLVLTAVLVVFGLSVFWLRRLSGVEEAERFLLMHTDEVRSPSSDASGAGMTDTVYGGATNPGSAP